MLTGGGEGTTAGAAGPETAYVGLLKLFAGPRRRGSMAVVLGVGGGGGSIGVGGIDESAFSRPANAVSGLEDIVDAGGLDLELAVSVEVSFDPFDEVDSLGV